MASADVILEEEYRFTAEDIVLDLVTLFEPEICLTTTKFWMQLPRTIDEVIQIPQDLESEWECLKMFFKRLANYFQTHKENSYSPSLKNVLMPLKKAMACGFKTLYSAQLRDMLKNWSVKSKDMLAAMEGLSCLSLPTTPTFTSTTTVLTQEDHADACGERKSKKRKNMSLEDAFSDLVDEEELEACNYPTGSVSSYISQRKDGVQSHRILTEK